MMNYVIYVIIMLGHSGKKNCFCEGDIADRLQITIQTALGSFILVFSAKVKVY
jgi:hypothetical protein